MKKDKVIMPEENLDEDNVELNQEMINFFSYPIPESVGIVLSKDEFDKTLACLEISKQYFSATVSQLGDSEQEKSAKALTLDHLKTLNTIIKLFRDTYEMECIPKDRVLH